MIVRWEIYTGFVGASHTGEWEVEDDINDEELDEMLQDAPSNLLKYTSISPSNSAFSQSSRVFDSSSSSKAEPMVTQGTSPSARSISSLRPTS